MANRDTLALPDGIVEADAREDRGLIRHASPFSLLILGGLMAAALAGVFGGGKSTVRIAEVPAATLRVTTPHTMRNGIFFETRIEVTARRDIADATVAVARTLWRDLTINTIVPQADKEAYKDGAFRMRYGPLKAGATLVVKIDGQINPPLTVGTRGTIALLDGDATLAAVPLSLRVLP